MIRAHAINKSHYTFLCSIIAYFYEFCRVKMQLTRKNVQQYRQYQTMSSNLSHWSTVKRSLSPLLDLENRFTRLRGITLNCKTLNRFSLSTLNIIKCFYLICVFFEFDWLDLVLYSVEIYKQRIFALYLIVACLIWTELVSPENKSPWIPERFIQGRPFRIENIEPPSSLPFVNINDLTPLYT